MWTGKRPERKERLRIATPRGQAETRAHTLREDAPCGRAVEVGVVPHERDALLRQAAEVLRHERGVVVDLRVPPAQIVRQQEHHVEPLFLSRKIAGHDRTDSQCPDCLSPAHRTHSPGSKTPVVRNRCTPARKHNHRGNTTRQDLDVPGVFVFAGLGALPVSPSLAIDPFFPNSPCFPEFYPAVLATPGFFVATPPVLGGGRSGAFVVAAPPNMPAAGIIIQAVAILPGPGKVAVSSPITLH